MEDYKKEVKIEKALKIGVILTIAATGSEMDSIGVVSNPQTKEKLSFQVLFSAMLCNRKS